MCADTCLDYCSRMTNSPATVASTAFTSNLPPVRSVRQMPLPLMASVSDDPISLWLKLGALEKLEQVVLDGYGDQLYGKTSRIPQVNKFLRQIPVFQNKIDEIHRAVSQGKLREVQHLIDRKKLAFCRDQMGASPLHKAVLFKQKEIMSYLISHYGSIIHTRDHQGRTPLHYAAVLQDNGEIFNILLEAGADIKATDMYGRRPKHYMQSQEGFTLQDLKASSNVSIRRTKQKNILPKQQQKKNKSKSHIQEIIDEGNLEKLEELVLQGKGDKLFGETSANTLVQDFLDKVPSYMERIQSIHKAVARGNLRDVKSLLDRKNLAITRDPTGATPLHKAVMYGHYNIAKYIAQNFPLSREAIDGDGRTPLHYAAVMKDNNEMYNMLIGLGVRSSILDTKGKTPEYYLQHPEQINLDYVLKTNQRANATYIANTASRLKLKVPNKGLIHTNSTEERDGNLFDADVDDKINANNCTFESNLPLYKRGIVLRNKPLNPPKTKRLEVTSANIQKWISNEDIEKLEEAVLEGYGDKVAKQTAENENIQNYIATSVPKLLEKIEAIHSAVSNDDLSGLQDYLDKDDLALAKDHLGMTPLHRAVLFNRTNILQFLINKFPETVNARDKEGRTALHYAASVAQKDKMRSYRLLLQAGGDPKIRDNQGRTPEYYRTHQVAIPSKAEIKSRTKQNRRTTSEPPAVSRNKLGAIVPSAISEKINICLQQADLVQLKELVLDGYGKYLVGRTSWNEEVRQFLRNLPSCLASIDSLHNAVCTNDTETVKSLLNEDVMLIRAKDNLGNTPIHLAVKKNQSDVVKYLINNFPSVLNMKDKTGRTVLHIAGQNNNKELYQLLAETGSDPMILDQKGRTAEYYMQSHIKPEQKTANDLTVVTEKLDVITENKNLIEYQNENVNTSNNILKEPQEEKLITKENKIEKLEENLENINNNENVEMIDEKKDEEKNNEEKNNEEKNNEEKNNEKTKTETKEDKEIVNTMQTPSTDTSTGDRLNELIDYWIKEKDLLRLEHVVIAGQGERLIGRTSDDKQVQEFLDLVPTYMARIRSVHEAVVRGNLGEVKSVLTRKRFALSRDHLGASPLHLAVLHSHTDILRYIINNFPETLDGPDNEGRTPLHYAAIMRDGGHYYKILKNAGADEEATDKVGHTAEYYMRHPGEMTIRNLLEGYKILTNNSEKPSTINIWQRPPTEEIEKQLTPPSSGENANKVTSNNKEAEENEQYNNHVEIKSNEDIIQEVNNEPKLKTNKINMNEHKETSCNENEEQPISFDERTEDGKYLSNVLGDVLVKALTEVSQKRPSDPIGYLATWLYHFASRSSKDRIRSPIVNGNVNTTGAKFFERIEERNDHTKTVENNDGKNLTELQTTPLDNLNKEPENEIQEVSLEFENHTKMKDEEGQTVLHFAASRSHPGGSFYGLLSQAESLLAERDSNYHTARDVAVESGMTDNVTTIDNYILDAFISQKSGFLQMLVHEGYDHLLTVTDSDGKDLISAIRLQTESEAIRALLQEIADFEKNREELHTFVRHDYQEGINKLIEKDHSLITSKNNKGRCSVHIAVLFGNINIIQLLVKANTSSVHVPDNLGRTPLHYAMAMPHIEEIGKILIKAGAIRTARDVIEICTPNIHILPDGWLSFHSDTSKLCDLILSHFL